MGAGAYMMLELVDPPVTYLTVVKAALIPAILYYTSLFLLVHFYAKRIAGSRSADLAATAAAARSLEAPNKTPPLLAGVVFAGSLVALIGLLVTGFTVIRSVSIAILIALVLAAFDRRTRLGPRQWVEAARRAAKGSVALIAAAACVGIVVAVVTLTGAGAKLPSLLLPMAEGNLTGALLVLMLSSIVLGMGLPSAVCYLLLATLIGPALGKLGVVPLAAHFFIFYFGMMSMVTPPVALAGYAAASIAKANILRASLAAFRFALVGFTLPFMFVYRPQLLLVSPTGDTPRLSSVIGAVAIALLGITPLAAGIAGYLRGPLGLGARTVLVTASLLMLFPGGPALPFVATVSWINVCGLAVFLAVLAVTWKRPLSQAVV
jgi:TRAP transporter 4TM/12TM fusion protein